MKARTEYTQDEVTPLDLKLSRASQVLTVQWKDGHLSKLDLVMLRKNCPCATCHAGRQQQSGTAELFPILKRDPGIGAPKATGARLVGNYAVQFLWSDGHDTGIYDFRYLRSLDAPNSR